MKHLKIFSVVLFTLASPSAFSQFVYIPLVPGSNSDQGLRPNYIANERQTLKYSETDLDNRIHNLDPAIEMVAKNRVNNCSITGTNGHYVLHARGNDVASFTDAEFILSNGSNLKTSINKLLENKTCKLAEVVSHKCTYRLTATGMLGENLDVIEEGMAAKGYTRVSTDANLTLSFVSGYAAGDFNGLKHETFGDSWAELKLGQENQVLFQTSQEGTSGMIGGWFKGKKIRSLTKKAVAEIPSCVM